MSKAFEQLAWGIVHAYNLDRLPRQQREQVFQWTIVGHSQGNPWHPCPVCSMVTIGHPTQKAA